MKRKPAAQIIEAKMEESKILDERNDCELWMETDFIEDHLRLELSF